MSAFLFLDIDGVLNNDKYLSRSKSLPDPFCWFDPECVARVYKILSHSGADLVVSSSWRKDSGLRYIFEQVGLPTTFDITPILYDGKYELPRGQEIETYLLNHNDEDYSYVILDDDVFDLNPDQLPYTIHCTDGLTDELTEKAIQIFNYGSKI